MSLASHINCFFVQRKSVPAEQQPKIKPSKCLGGLVILIKIHAKAEPNMNVTITLTGMNHLNHNKKRIKICELKQTNQLDADKILNCDYNRS